MRIKFSPHFIQRMIERKVSVKQIYEVIKKGVKKKQRRGMARYELGNTAVVVCENSCYGITVLKARAVAIKNGKKEYVFDKYGSRNIF